MTDGAVPYAVMSAATPAVSEPQDDEPMTQVLPFPPVTQPDPGLSALILPSDEPTVDDLPAPHIPRASSEDP